MHARGTGIDTLHFQSITLFMLLEIQNNSLIIMLRRVGSDYFRINILANLCRDRLEVRTLRCGRSNPDVNPGLGNNLIDPILSSG